VDGDHDGLTSIFDDKVSSIIEKKLMPQVPIPPQQ
jgi:hypothetical protein